jgi:hypothetical protein
MESHESGDAHGHGDRGHGHDCNHVVGVHVNNAKVVLQPGRYDVATFKKIAGVPQADDLDELVNCKLHHVPDNGHMNLKGCEIFISHVKEGGAS